MKTVKGSLTAELSLLFPIIFLAVILMMNAGLSSLYALSGSISCGEGLMVAQVAFNKEPSSHVSSWAEAFLMEESAKSPAFSQYTVEEENTFLSRAVTILAEGWMAPMSNMPWSIQQKKNLIDPVTFRNRVDLILEVISQ